jgi:hypothetical protein
MTVIANFLVEGVPVLIGDTLITSGDLSLSSITVPTVSRLPPLRRPITGFCRKAYIIEKRLAVAWTGSALKAHYLLRGLRDHIRRRGVTEKELQGFLRCYQFPAQGGGVLRLLGWIAEPDPRPFWWSTDCPDEVVYDDHDVEGCGAEVFRSAFFAKDMASVGSDLTREEHVSLACLSGISRLLTLEIIQGLPLAEGFGFCYDIVVWSKYRFKYVPSYTQINLVVGYNPSIGGGHYNFRSPILIYNSIQNSAAAFWAITYEDQQNHGQTKPVLGIDPTIIRSILHDDRAIDPPRASIRSKFFCAFLWITDENGLRLLAPVCVSDGAGPDDGVWLSTQGTREIFHLNMAYVPIIHREALRMANSRSPPDHSENQANSDEVSDLPKHDDGEAFP